MQLKKYRTIILLCIFLFAGGCFTVGFIANSILTDFVDVYKDTHQIVRLAEMDSVYFNRITWGVSANHDFSFVSKDSLPRNRKNLAKNYIAKISNSDRNYYDIIGDSLFLYQHGSTLEYGIDSSRLNIKSIPISNIEYQKKFRDYKAKYF